MISQHELIELETIEANLPSYFERVDRRQRLRAELLRRLDRGETVEPGRLDVTVHETQAVRFTRANLTAALGEAVVAGIVAEIGPSVSRRLVMRRQEHELQQTSGGDRNGPRAREARPARHQTLADAVGF